MSSESEESVFWSGQAYGYEGIFPSDLGHNYSNIHRLEAESQTADDRDEYGTKRITLSPESHNQEGNPDGSEQSSPLGLTLRKTPSFLNLVQRSLSQGVQADFPGKTRTRKDDIGSPSSSEKLKASNFPAIFLKIGAWQRITRNEGDLTAKLYYAKRKLVWEVLDGALKSKIEMQWSDIISIRATTPDNEPGTLEIELNQPPSFYREINPQPRKHTLWQQASDFTGGQAPIWRYILIRRHYVRFPPGILDRHYEKLLQYDHRLYTLSQNPFPRHESPYFDPTMFGIPELPLGFNGYASPYLPRTYPTASPPIAPPRPLVPNALPGTEFPFRHEGGSNSNQFSAPAHSPWGQGPFNVTPGNDAFQFQGFQQLNLGLINDIESHLLGEPRVRPVPPSDEGTLGSSLEPVSSLMEPCSTVGVMYDVNFSGTDYQGNGPDQLVHYDSYMDPGVLDEAMGFDWMPAQQVNDTADEQTGNNNRFPPFIFPDSDDDPSDKHLF